MASNKFATIQQYMDSTGPITGAKLYFFAAGSTVPKPVYNDNLLTSETTQPLVSDAMGIFPEYFTESGAYKTELYDSDDNLIATRDWINNTGAGESDDAFLVKVSGGDQTGDYLENKIETTYPERLSITTSPDDYQTLVLDVLGAPPSGDAGGDLDGTYPAPVVKELTGIGSSLSVVPTDFTFPPYYGGGGNSVNGGRGIVYGRAFIDNADTQVWAAQCANGEIYKTSDFWRHTTEDNSFFSATGYKNTHGIHFAYLASFEKYGWIVSSFSESIQRTYIALHEVANYYSDGTIVEGAWQEIIIEAGPSSIYKFATNGPVTCFVGDSSIVGRTDDFSTFTEIGVADAPIGGIAFDGESRWMVTEKSTGKLYQSNDDGATWTQYTGFLLDGAVATTLPNTGGEIWSAILCGAGLWVICNSSGLGKSYCYSTDGNEWFSVDADYMNFYSSWFDGVRFFATNYASGANPIYQIIVASIPAHKMLMAENGISIGGNAYLPYIPGAAGLATDNTGKVIKATATRYSTTIDILAEYGQSFIITHNLGVLRPLVNLTYYNQSILVSTRYDTERSLSLVINSSVEMLGANVEVRA